jgi:hypothetical protein
MGAMSGPDGRGRSDWACRPESGSGSPKRSKYDAKDERE